MDLRAMTSRVAASVSAGDAYQQILKESKKWMQRFGDDPKKTVWHMQKRHGEDYLSSKDWKKLEKELSAKHKASAALYQISFKTNGITKYEKSIEKIAKGLLGDDMGISFVGNFTEVSSSDMAGMKKLKDKVGDTFDYQISTKRMIKVRK